MIYLHESPISEQLVRHWANESEIAEDTVGTYYIRQIETGNVYADAVDVIPCPYSYEETDIPIEKEVDENALFNRTVEQHFE